MKALGWVMEGGSNFENLLRVLQLFIKEFSVSPGLESSEYAWFYPS
jgi:hypothetical protein